MAFYLNYYLERLIYRNSINKVYDQQIDELYNKLK